MSSTHLLWSHDGAYINQGPFPIICAQGNPQTSLPTACPAPAQAPQRNAIAVGGMAMFDNDPCHCGSMPHGPTNYHLTIYDGQLWWMLRHNSPRISGGTVTPKDGATMPPPSDIGTPGDFGLVAGYVETDPPVGYPYNWVTLTIRTSTIKVEMTSQMMSRAAGYSGMEYYIYNVMDNIPRSYLGPFNALRGGVGPGCRLNSNTSWSACAPGTNRSCINQVGNLQRAMLFDDLSLHGGVGYSDNGACCLDNGSCVEGASQSHCVSEPPAGLGGIWGGTSSTCNTVTCCPIPFADVDLDGDVDQVDFAAFQVCYTGSGGSIPSGCACFNRDGDSDVDVADFTAFNKCYTGPNVPFNVSNPPTGCVP
ncbi:MAG TPA: hypothetical protein VLM89_02350 [Phycisphaerae bacterium]|nr:hypothetical protein [Phycisphaerae bacterium]